MGVIDPRIAKAIEFHDRRALRFLVVRALVLVAGIVVIALAKRWWIGVPVGLFVFFFFAPEIIERTLLRSHLEKGRSIKADPSKVVWVHYWAHGEKICPVFLHDESADFVVLHLPSGFARPLLDAFRAFPTPPLITTTDEEKRIAEPRQKFLGRLHELEAHVTSAPQPALQALAPAAVVAITTLRERYGTTLEAMEGRDSIAETVDRLVICYSASKGTRDPNQLFNEEIATLLAKLQDADIAFGARSAKR